MASGKQDEGVPSETGTRIVIEASVLAKAMKHAAAVVEARNTVPILSNVRLTADGGELEIVTSDMDVEFRQRLPLKEQGALATTVDAKRLFSLVSAVDGGAQVSLALDGHRLVVRAGRSRWTLPTLPAHDFPVMPETALPAEVEFGCDALAAALARTLPFVSAEATKYYISGPFLEPEADKLRITATDAFRIVALTTPIDWPQDAPAVIMGPKFCRVLQSLAGEGAGSARLSWDDRKARADVGAVTLIGKVIDGTFPDYRRAIPPEGAPTTVEPKALLAALRRIDLIGERKDRLISIERGDGKLTIAARTDVGSEATEELPAQVGGTHASGFNSQYLGALVEAIGGETIEIHQADASATALIRRVVPDDAIGALWPVRL